MEKVEFYYEVSPLAKMAHDGEGNDIKAYVKTSMELDLIPSEDSYVTYQEAVKTIIAQHTNVDVKHLKGISKEEYDANHEA